MSELESALQQRDAAEAALRKGTGLLKLLQTVADAANEAHSVEGVIRIVLHEVCSRSSWDVGHCYTIDQTDELAPSDIWEIEDPTRFETFRRVTMSTRLLVGIGLPGRVLASKKPAWIPDVTVDDNFPRAKLAQEIGVRAGFATPVMSGVEIAAVLEFYSHEVREPDEALLEVMGSVGTLLGRVIERSQAAETSARVAQSAQRLSAAAVQVLESAGEQSMSVIEQSAAITQTSLTVDRLRSLAEDTALRAEDVAERARTSVRVSTDGGGVVESTLTSMGGMRERVEAIAQNIQLLSDQTKQIGEITTTVDDVAGQSNLLALNATIEAARAGEHGKGFAVVASEVRNLALRSKEATTQVKQILSEVQEATSSAVASTEQGELAVEEGRGFARSAGEAIRQLSETITETAAAADVIVRSAREQSSAVDQVSDAMAEINEAAAQFVTGMEEAKAAAEEVAALAMELHSLAEQYRV